MYGWLRAAGEELGWRCYLQPLLLQQYGAGTTFFLIGIAWGLFHVPVMILMGHKPYTVIFQALSCIPHAYLEGWLALATGHALWAPATAHWAWNRFNPFIIGSVYVAKDGNGMLTGRQWLINGEGAMGVIVISPFAWYLVSEASSWM